LATSGIVDARNGLVLFDDVRSRVRRSGALTRLQREKTELHLSHEAALVFELGRLSGLLDLESFAVGPQCFVLRLQLIDLSYELWNLPEILRVLHGSRFLVSWHAWIPSPMLPERMVVELLPTAAIVRFVKEQAAQQLFAFFGYVEITDMHSDCDGRIEPARLEGRNVQTITTGHSLHATKHEEQ